VTAADRAYAHTKDRILDGAYAEGQLIGEGEVSDAVGVSRTPVREAFLRLEAEGMLRLYPKRGALVVPISAVELEDRLAAAIAAQERHAAENDAVAFVDADREFHRVFVAATGNAILLRTHDSLRDQQNRMGLAALSSGANRTARILEQHRAIVGAVGDRDLAEAERLIDLHLGETLHLLRRASAAAALNHPRNS
jgi:DNA-binding GntR family transcriptional regulator